MSLEIYELYVVLIKINEKVERGVSKEDIYEMFLILRGLKLVLGRDILGKYFFVI